MSGILKMLLEALPFIIPIIQDCFGDNAKGMKAAVRWASSSESNLRTGLLVLLDVHAQRVGDMGGALDEEVMTLRSRIEAYEPKN